MKTYDDFIHLMNAGLLAMFSAYVFILSGDGIWIVACVLFMLSFLIKAMNGISK